MTLSISEASKRSGCPAPTIRYYESIGLIAAPDRSRKGRRLFEPKDIHRLVFIRRCRDFGMTIGQVRSLMAASQQGTRACAPARAVIEDHLRAIRRQRAELRLLEASLQQVHSRCCEVCETGKNIPCTIFDDIGGQS